VLLDGGAHLPLLIIAAPIQRAYIWDLAPSVIGDLDPSGVHMPLALSEDVAAFARDYGGEVSFHRLAVTPEQVAALNLPSAPPKPTGTREPCQ
jgi:hypothetical protein